MTSFADLTTMQVGGQPDRLVEPTTTDELLRVAREVFAGREPWFVLGGGSNLVVSDEGFPGVVIRVATRGVDVVSEVDGGSDDGDGDRAGDATASERRVRIRVAAGEPWDDLVDLTVERGWAGIEALSGVPGSTGAAPVQNIGAYGQEVSTTIVSVDFLDADTLEFVRIPRANLGLAYRTSAFKQNVPHPARNGLITAVDFELAVTSGLSEPVAFPQLAAALGVELGTRVPLRDVQARVLELRASKGMVLDAADRDTASSGSFFTNPIVSRDALEAIPTDAPRWEQAPEGAAEARDIVVPLGEEPAVPPVAPLGDVKLSAAWLIEHAGIARGFHLPGSGAAISSKHTLAITNRGGATAGDVAELARYVQSQVAARFGVVLHPEPILLGLEL